jgi:hypothetical protein
MNSALVLTAILRSWSAYSLNVLNVRYRSLIDRQMYRVSIWIEVRWRT